MEYKQEFIDRMLAMTAEDYRSDDKFCAIQNELFALSIRQGESEFLVLAKEMRELRAEFMGGSSRFPT